MKRVLIAFVMMSFMCGCSLLEVNEASEKAGQRVIVLADSVAKAEPAIKALEDSGVIPVLSDETVKIPVSYTHLTLPTKRIV